MKKLLIAVVFAVTSSAVVGVEVLYCVENASAGLAKIDGVYKPGGFELKKWTMRVDGETLMLKGGGLDIGGNFECVYPMPTLHPELLLCHDSFYHSIGYNKKTGKGVSAEYFADLTMPRGEVGDTPTVSLFTCDAF